MTRSRSPSPSRTVSTILSRVEAERDEALADLRRASSEIESLQEQLKVGHLSLVLDVCNLCGGICIEFV